MPPLPVDGHAPHTHWRNDTERRSKEASLCNNVLVFFLCGGLCNYQSIKTAAVGRKLDQKDSALLVSTSTTSEHLALTGSLVFYIYSSKLILLYSDQGRQTIENQLLHSLYQCMHIITSPLCGSLIKLDVLGVGFIWNIKHLEVVFQKIGLKKGLADWNSLSKLLYHNTLLSTCWIDWVSSHVCSYLQRYCSLPTVTYTGNARQTTHQKSTHVLSGRCALPYP